MNKLFALDKYAFKLTLVAGVFLFVTRLFFSDSFWVVAANSTLDFLLLISLYLLFFAGLCPLVKKNVVMGNLVKVFYYIIFTFNLIIFNINSIFLDESVLMKYSLANFDWSVFWYLLTDMVPLRYLLMLPLVILIIFGLASLEFKRLRFFESHFKYVFAAMFIGCISLFIVDLNIFSNVYTNTVYEAFTYNSTYEFTIDKDEMLSVEYPSDFFNKQLTDYDVSIPRNRRILLFVMEQTSLKTFIKDLKKIPGKQNFFSKVKHDTHIFTNYYTTGQDSRTAIWGMLNSQFIPFESYISGWERKYGAVLENNNLIDLFNQKGYNTHVAGSVYNPGLLIAAHNWSDITVLRSFDKNNVDFLCLHELENQQACEDNIILEDVKDVIRNNDNLFLMQEFIYGHGTTYEAEKGKSRTEYYNDYLFELYNFLEEENLVETTTILIVADHGEKGYFDKQIWNYNVPFLVIDDNLDYNEIDGLYSSLYFNDILLHYLSGSALKPASNVFFIGQTQSAEIGYVDDQGNHFLGKLYNDRKVKIKEIVGIDLQEVVGLVNTLVKYRIDLKEKSNEQYYYCKYCHQNLMKAKDLHE